MNIWLAATALAMVTLAGPADAGPAGVAASPAPVAQVSGSSASATVTAVDRGPDSAQAQAMMQTFARMHAQHQQLETRARAQMLTALSPAHRTLVAALVGQLAVAPNPDPSATARQLEAALSPSEQQTILRVNSSALAQAQAMAEQMQSQIVSQLTSEQRSTMQRQFAKMKADLQRLTPEQRNAIGRQNAQWRTAIPPTNVVVPTASAQDAGTVLLRTLLMPAMMPLGISAHFSVGAVSAPNSVIIQSPPNLSTRH